jgi:hypothetical protein
VRRNVGRKAVERTKLTFEDVTGYEVLVALTKDTTAERERSLLRIAADVARRNDGSVTVVQFDEVPDQASLEHASETQSPADVRFERQTEDLSAEFDVPIHYGEIVSHDTERAIVNFARHEDPDFLLLEQRNDPLYASVFGTGIEWVTRNAPTNVLLVEERGLERIHTITVVTGNGPFDPEKIAVANALAAETASRIDLLYPVKRGATDAQRATIMEYLAELEDLCTVPVHRSIVDTDDPNRDIVSEIGAADLLIIGTDGGPITGSLFGRPADWIVDSVEATAIQVQARGTKRPNILRRAFERLVF